MLNNFLGKKTKLTKNSTKNNIKLTSSPQKIKTDLTSSKFRILNEKLYTMSNEEAKEYFKDNKEDFEIYHKGFSMQCEKWPIIPNDLILKTLKLEKYKNKTIADVGCGEAKLAQNLVPFGYKIYSFDLVSLNKFVIQCDMKKLPLKNKEIDIAIFCLSLMNKNFIPFIYEANRVLKIKGKLLIAEISSRIINLKNFLEIFKQLNFKLFKQKNIENYFTILSFKKISDAKINKKLINKENTFDILKPCLYKKR